MSTQAESAMRKMEEEFGSDANPNHHYQPQQYTAPQPQPMPQNNPAPIPSAPITQEQLGTTPMQQVEDMANQPAPQQSDDAKEGVNQGKAFEELSQAELEAMTAEELGQYLENPANLESNEPVKYQPKPAEQQGEKEPVKYEGQQQPAQQDNELIPRARLNAESEKRRALEEENQRLKEERAYLAGKSERQQPAQQPQPERNPLKDVENASLNLRKQYRAELEKLAQKYDDGDLKTVEWERQKALLEDNYEKVNASLTKRKNEIIEEQNRPDPEVLSQQINQNPRLAAATAKLKEENPWLNNVPEHLMDALTNEAISALQANGYPLNNDVETTWLIRSTMANVGRAWGLDKSLAPQPQPANGQPAPQQSNGQQQPVPYQGNRPQSYAQSQQPVPYNNGVTPEQRKDKVNLANNHPPTPTQAGVNAPTSHIQNIVSHLDEMSDMDVANSMTIEELGRLAESGGTIG